MNITVLIYIIVLNNLFKTAGRFLNLFLFFNQKLYFTGGKLYGIYDPFVVAIGIMVLTLLLVAFGIAVYSCNWPYFFEICTCSSDSNVSDTPTSSSSEKPTEEQQLPPKYEEIELQNIYHSNRFISIDLTEDTFPPKYEDTRLP